MFYVAVDEFFNVVVNDSVFWELRSKRQRDENGNSAQESDMCVINNPNLQKWSGTKENLPKSSNSAGPGWAGGSLWQRCLTTSLTEPSSLVRESGKLHFPVTPVALLSGCPLALHSD